jgi:hypothetical protein
MEEDVISMIEVLGTQYARMSPDNRETLLRVADALEAADHDWRRSAAELAAVNVERRLRDDAPVGDTTDPRLDG